MVTILHYDDYIANLIFNFQQRSWKIVALSIWYMMLTGRNYLLITFLWTVSGGHFCYWCVVAGFLAEEKYPPDLLHASGSDI